MRQHMEATQTRQYLDRAGKPSSRQIQINLWAERATEGLRSFPKRGSKQPPVKSADAEHRCPVNAQGEVSTDLLFNHSNCMKQEFIQGCSMPRVMQEVRLDNHSAPFWP